MERFRLDGRVAMVTGASAGLGAHFARVLDEAGASVVLVARRADRLEGLAAELDDALVAPADLADPDQRASTVTAALERFGRVDVLVNNAGISDGPQRAESEDPADFALAVEVNLTAAFHLSRLVAPGMIERRGGSIVNITSVHGLVASSPNRQAGYVASKTGLVGLTRELACQWATAGVRVNAIAPGYFATDLTGEMIATDSGREWIERNTPMRPGRRRGRTGWGPALPGVRRQHLRHRPGHRGRRRLDGPVGLLGSVGAMTKSDGGFRIEHDSMGEVRVPFSAKYAAQTQRAVENFPISGLTIDRRLIRALAMIKGEAAKVNAGLDEVPDVDRTIADAIAAAADEVAEGAVGRRLPGRRVPDRLGHLVEHERQRGHRHPRLREARPGRTRCTPTTTSTPRSPRTTCSPRPCTSPWPRPCRTTCCRRSTHLAASLSRKADEFASVVKSGRTHLMDATPVTLGQEFGGYAAQISQGAERIEGAARPGRASSRSAAPPSAPASTPRRPSPPRSSPRWPSAPGCPSPRPATTSPPRPAGTGSSRPPGCCGSSPWR